MVRSKTATFVLMLFAAPAMALLVSACGGGGDELPLIRAYFRATNTGDRRSLANIALFAWNAQEQGAVTSPSIDSVGEVNSRPLRVQDLVQALADAEAEEDTFTEEKIVYQNEEFDAINRVLEAEREEEEVSASDRDVQEAWTDWLDRTMEHSRNVSNARQELAVEQETAALSIFDARNPIDINEYDGEIRTKDVQITATVATGGTESERSLTVTLLQTVLEGAGPDAGQLIGRWVVANIS